MFGFKQNDMKIMSKSPVRHLVRVQGKIKLKKKKDLHISRLLLYFSIFKCNSRQPISVAALG
jgi:hypothetical protein